MHKGYCHSFPFSKAIEQEYVLRSLGVKMTDIYMEGRGSETIAECVKAFRGDPGEIVVASGLRVLGRSREHIVTAVKWLKSKKIVVVDIANKERSDTHGVEMMDRAMKLIAGSARVRNDRKFARRIGAKGGEGKLKSMQAKRMPEAIAGPIWRSPELTARRRLELMNPPVFELQWTEATAYRHLGNQS